MIEQVVCIRDDWGRHADLILRRPVLGGIYTIRCARKCYSYPQDYYLFEEIINPPTPHPDFPGSGGEPVFCSTHFCPVRKTSVDA